MRPIPERQLEIVYQQLARTAGFRGFRPSFLFSISLVSLLSTVTALLLAGLLSIRGQVHFWTGVAVAISVAVYFLVVRPALFAASSVSVETARSVITQLLPSGALAAVVTATALLRYPQALPYLPTVWLVLFGLGITALSPLLLAQVEFASMVYFAGATIAFVLADRGPAVFALTVGCPFAVGHLVTGYLLRSAETLQRRSVNSE